MEDCSSNWNDLIQRMGRWAIPIFAIGMAHLFVPDAEAQKGQSQLRGTVTGKVVQITDGDTYEVQTTEAGQLTVRLHGVDAPESDQPYGREATEAARQYVGGKRVRLHVQGNGPYGRVIAKVKIQNAELGELLVQGGYAWHYERYAPQDDRLKRFQQKARRNRRGLWGRQDPVPPWEWRHQ